MPTFKRRNSVVDARQFTGERQNALDLILWVNSNRGNAMWSDVSKRLELNVWGRTAFVHKGYWIVLEQDGTFNRMSPEDFNEEFVQV